MDFTILIRNQVLNMLWNMFGEKVGFFALGIKFYMLLVRKIRFAEVMVKSFRSCHMLRGLTVI